MADKKKSERSEAKPTPEWRTAYPSVHERRTKRADGSPIKNPSFEIVVLAPKTNADPMQCSNYRILADHIYEAARKMWPQSLDANGQWVWPAGAKWPIMDGDVPYKPKAAAPGQPAKPVDPNAHAWRKGHWQVEATRFLDPGPRVAVLQNGQAVEIPSKVVAGHTMYKSGDYARLSLHAWAYERETFGVNMGFEGVMFTRPGEPIGSSGPRSTEQMFGVAAAPAGQSPTAPGPTAPPAPPVMAASPPLAPQQAAPTYAPPAPPAAPAPAYAAPGGYAPPPAPPAPPAAPSATLPPFPGAR